MIRRPPRSTHCISSAASDVYKRQDFITEVSERYIELYESITGDKFQRADISAVGARIEKNVNDYLKTI